MSAIVAHDDDGSPPSPPLYLLEVTVISAQDLHRRRRLSHRVRAYAVAWIDGARKLRTEVDLAGGADPTWNDRFLFRVDAGFLKSETAAVVVEVRETRRLGADVVLGRTGIVVSTFVRVHSSRLTAAPAVATAPTGRQVAALQLRRPRSLRPQGVLNVAVTLLGAAQARAVAPIYHMPGSPDAFAMKDLVAMRPAPFLCEITEEGAAEARDSEYHARRQRPLVEHSGPLDPRGAAIEQRKLAMMLEKWRVDLSPDHGDHDDRGGGKSGRWLRRSSCFGRQESWER